MNELAAVKSLSWLQPGFSAEAISAVTAKIDEQGYAEVPGFFAASDIMEAQREVRLQVERNGGEYVAFEGKGPFSGTILAKLGASEGFRAHFENIVAAKSGAPQNGAKFQQITRCLIGLSGKPHAYYFHFDSYYLTALVPIAIPTEGETGDLLMFPNIRPIRKRYSRNVGDKLLIELRLTQVLLKLAIKVGIVRPIRIKLVPTSLYFFWGYRTLHANEPCDPKNLRATVLFHFANPHENGVQPAFLRSARKLWSRL